MAGDPLLQIGQFSTDLVHRMKQRQAMLDEYPAPPRSVGSRPFGMTNEQGDCPRRFRARGCADSPPRGPDAFLSPRRSGLPGLSAGDGKPDRHQVEPGQVISSRPHAFVLPPARSQEFPCRPICMQFGWRGQSPRLRFSTRLAASTKSFAFRL